MVPIMNAKIPSNTFRRGEVAATHRVALQPPGDQNRSFDLIRNPIHCPVESTVNRMLGGTGNGPAIANVLFSDYVNHLACARFPPPIAKTVGETEQEHNGTSENVFLFHTMQVVSYPTPSSQSH
jgi:hypothetical protein